MRRNLPALHDGGIVMLDASNPNVLSFMRTGANSVIVSLNMSATPQTISLDLAPAALHAGTAKTLLTDEPSLAGPQSLKQLTLPAYASWIGSPAQP